MAKIRITIDFDHINFSSFEVDEEELNPDNFDKLWRYCIKPALFSMVFKKFKHKFVTPQDMINAVQDGKDPLELEGWRVPSG